MSNDNEREMAALRRMAEGGPDVLPAEVLRQKARAEKAERAMTPKTDADAEAMLAVLSKHCGVPVMPITRYCEALRTWERALGMRASRMREGFAATPNAPNAARLRSYEEAANRVHRVFFDISKSNLLARLLYAGEPLRTRICPEHKGTWQGIEWGPEIVCKHGCGLMGWIPDAAPVAEIVGLPEKTDGDG